MKPLPVALALPYLAVAATGAALVGLLEVVLVVLHLAGFLVAGLDGFVRLHLACIHHHLIQFHNSV